MLEQYMPQEAYLPHHTDEQFETKNPLVYEEQILETRETSGSNNLEGGMNQNKVIFVSFKDDGAGVFKPRAGERPSRIRRGAEVTERKVQPGTYFLRERAAYLISKVLSFNVPPTIIRELNGEIGSIQKFVPDAQPFSKAKLDAFDINDYKTQLLLIAIFDYIIWNSDRHGGNILIHKKTKTAVPIDHGYSFAPDPLKQQWYVDSTPLPQDLVKQLQIFCADPQRVTQLQRDLLNLIPEDEIDACIWRIHTITNIISKGIIEPNEVRLLTYNQNTSL